MPGSNRHMGKERHVMQLRYELAMKEKELPRDFLSLIENEDTCLLYTSPSPRDTT